MSITDLLIEQYSKSAYRAGYEACEEGKHLIVPDEHADEREAWTLGWNDSWTALSERQPRP